MKKLKYTIVAIADGDNHQYFDLVELTRKKDKKKFFILGAPDPEMEEIERVLRERPDCVVGYAMVNGKRVRQESAYRADSVEGFDLNVPCDVGGMIVAVECLPGPDANWAWLRTGLAWDKLIIQEHEEYLRCFASVVVVDHHRSGDPGYGRPPAEHMEASSLGQVLGLLGLEPNYHQKLIAAADHCLVAAYRGECPGVDPDALMVWRATSRAVFRQRSVREVLADIEAAREVLRSAPKIELAPGLLAADLQDQHVLEVQEAAARDGVCFITHTVLPDGRTKVVCHNADRAHTLAFIEKWGPAKGLVDIYWCDDNRVAGGYLGSLPG